MLMVSFRRKFRFPTDLLFVSVVTDTKDEIIIKAVNFAGDVDPVSITLDCQVQSDYTVTLLSGEKGDENSFEEPEKVKNITVNNAWRFLRVRIRGTAIFCQCFAIEEVRSVLEVDAEQKIGA